MAESDTPSIDGLMEKARQYAHAYFNRYSYSTYPGYEGDEPRFKASLRAYAERLAASPAGLKPELPKSETAHLTSHPTKGLQAALPEVTRDASGVPPGEWDGLSPKQAWWAGYRVGKGLPPDMPRSEAVRASPNHQGE